MFGDDLIVQPVFYALLAMCLLYRNHRDHEVHTIFRRCLSSRHPSTAAVLNTVFRHLLRTLTYLDLNSTILFRMMTFLEVNTQRMFHIVISMNGSLLRTRWHRCRYLGT